MGDTFVLVGEAPSSHPAPRMVARPTMDRKQGVRVTDLTLRILDAGLPGRQPEINGNPEAVGETHKAEANENSD
jgi:hypothetical protein